MKLNPDCIRDILLVTEDKTNLHTSLMFNADDAGADNDLLSNYSTEELLYHVKQCELTGFFNDAIWTVGGTCIVDHLSPKGHEFLSDIKSDTNWKKVKDISKKVGSSSLNAITTIATGVISSIIQSQLGPK